MAIRRAVIEQVGAFEPRFFMYCEDIDLNWRAQLAGWKCIYTPEAVVYHHLSATGGGPLASYYVGRNTLWTIARNYPAELYRANRGRIWSTQWRIATERGTALLAGSGGPCPAAGTAGRAGPVAVVAGRAAKRPPGRAGR